MAWWLTFYDPRLSSLIFKICTAILRKSLGWKTASVICRKSLSWGWGGVECRPIQMFLCAWYWNHFSHQEGLSAWEIVAFGKEWKRKQRMFHRNLEDQPMWMKKSLFKAEDSHLLVPLGWQGKSPHRHSQSRWPGIWHWRHRSGCRGHSLWWGPRQSSALDWPLCHRRFEIWSCDIAAAMTSGGQRVQRLSGSSSFTPFLKGGEPLKNWYEPWSFGRKVTSIACSSLTETHNSAINTNMASNNNPDILSTTQKEWGGRLTQFSGQWIWGKVIQWWPSCLAYPWNPDRVANI